MKNIWILTKANIRKNKSQAINISGLALIAAMLLYIGLAVSTGVTTAFDTRAEELNSAHFVTWLQWDETSEQDGTIVYEFMTGLDDVAAAEKQESLMFWGTSLNNSEGETMTMRGVFITRADEHQQMNPPTFFGGHKPLTGYAIYIPHSIFLTGRYAFGDDFILNLAGTTHTFTVAGDIEDIVAGSTNGMLVRLYVSDEMFAQLAAESPGSIYTMVSARMYDLDYLPSLVTAFSEAMDYFNTETLISLDYFNYRLTRTINPVTVGQMILIFSAMLLIIAIVTVRFGIINNIAQSMANIGVLKAVGYRNRQIITAIVLQFGVIALIGSALGVLLAQFIMPFIVNMLAPEFSLQWNPLFDAPIMAASLVVTFILVVAFSVISSSKIRKLHPIVALRDGITNHSFKKNRLPLDKYRAPLNLLLSMKQILNNKKQGIMICIIVAGLSFAAVAGLTAHYNINVNRDAMLRIQMGEVADIIIFVNDIAEDENFAARMREHADVRSAFGFIQFTDLTVNGTTFFTRVAEDTALLEANTIVTGRFPILDNEIAIGLATMQSLGLSIGDWVTISEGELEKRFLITGANNATIGVITADGIRHVRPGFVFEEIWVNLHPEVDAHEFASFISEYESDVITDIGMLYEAVQADWDSLGGVFGIVSWAIVFTVAIVVVLVLYLVIKTVILRKRKDIGIQKALGFTTFQLMNQIAFSIIPPLFVGVILGAIGSYFAFDPLYAVLLGLSGVARIDMPTPVHWVIVICITLILLAYAVSMLITWRIRKISPYALISE